MLFIQTNEKKQTVFVQLVYFLQVFIEVSKQIVCLHLSFETELTKIITNLRLTKIFTITMYYYNSIQITN